MKICKRRKVIAITLILMLLAGNAFALIPIPILNLFETYESFGKVVYDTLGGIIVRLAYGQFMDSSLFDPLKKNYDHLPELILMNPKMLTESNGEFTGNIPIEDLTNFFIKLTQPFYVFAIAFVAFYLLFVSGSPLGRARAKSSLIKLVVSMGLIMLTIPIIQLSLDVSDYITGNILNLADVQPGIAVIKGAIDGVEENFWMALTFNYMNALYLLMFTGIMFGGFLLLIAVRYFLIIFFTVLFPVTVFLFAFYFTRRLGAQIFKETLAWIFIQPLMAFILVSISISIGSMPMLGDSSVRTAFGLAAVVALIISPLIATHIMDWLAMLMIMMTAIEFPGMHGLVGMIDELQIESPEEEEITPPTPIRPPRIPGSR